MCEVAHRQGSLAYLARKGVSTKIPQSDLESTIGLIDNDLDRDEGGIWIDWHVGRLRCHDGNCYGVTEVAIV